MEIVHLRVCIVDGLVEAHGEARILLRQRLVEVLLVANVLGGLVGPEAEGSSSAFHDDARTEATQDTGFVFFAWVEVGDDGVIRVGEL